MIQQSMELPIVRRQNGQAMVETILVLPLLLIVLLATVQLAELFVTMMATHWAARMSARIVAVQMHEPGQSLAKAELAALQILAPFLPSALTLKGHIEFKHGNETLDHATRYFRTGERGNVVVDLEFWVPLRIPLGNRFFADSSVTTSTVRKISARAQFPLMYAPLQKEE